MSNMNVTIIGLPPNVTLSKLIFSLKKILLRVGVERLWIRQLADCKNNVREAVVEFNTFQDALKAKNRLDNFVYLSGTHKFILSAYLDEDNSQIQQPAYSDYNMQRKAHYSHDKEFNDQSRPYQDNSQYYGNNSMQYETSNYNRHYDDEPQYDSYARNNYGNNGSRDRSRSPKGYGADKSKVNIELDLLIKQRQVIKEERRLLLQKKKKLNLIREFGQSAIDQLEYHQDHRSLHHNKFVPPNGPYSRGPQPRGSIQPRRMDYKERRQLRVDKPWQDKSKDSKMPLNNLRLSFFKKPCKVILMEMAPLISEKEGFQKEELIELIRVTLRKRLAAVLMGTSIMSLHEIVTCYRKSHPSSTDNDLVMELRDKIKASLMLPEKMYKKDTNIADTKTSSTNLKKDEEIKMETEPNQTQSLPVKESNLEDIKLVPEQTKSESKPKQATSVPKKVESQLVDTKTNTTQAKSEPGNKQDKFVKLDIKSELVKERPESKPKQTTPVAGKTESQIGTKTELIQIESEPEKVQNESEKVNIKSDVVVQLLDASKQENGEASSAPDLSEGDWQVEQLLNSINEEDDWVSGGSDWLDD